MKTILCIVLSLLFFSQTFSQTYGEKYDLEFKRFNTCTSGWAEFQRGTALSLDSMMSLNGKIPIKISYNTKDSVPMKFNLNFVIPLPQYKRGEVCTVTVNQKSNLPGKAYFALSSIDENANIVFHDSVWLNNTQWESKLLSFKLNNEKGIRISINYRGNKDSLQSLWLDKVAISIGGKDIAQLDVNRVDKESALETRELFNKEHIIPLSTENNNCFLPILEQLKDTRIIGLGECTHGSRETKAAFNEFVKSAIQNSKVRLVMIELPMEMLISYNLYIQGITHDNYITLADRLLSDARSFRYDTKLLAELLDWLRTYNSANKSKVYLRGFDVNYRSPDFFLYKYHDAFLGPKEIAYVFNAPEKTVFEKNKETLNWKLNKLTREHNYIELISMMENDTLAQKILGKKNIEEYKYFVENSLEQLVLGKDLTETREFLMAKNIQSAIDLFLEKDEKAIIFGNSGHITHTPYIKDYPFENIQAGCFLTQWYGDKYYNISFQVAEGEYTDDGCGNKSKPVATPLEKPIFQSLEGAALQTGIDYFYYSSLYLGKKLILYKDIPRASRYENKDILESFVKHFDACIFIRKSTPLIKEEVDPQYIYNFQ